MFLRDTNANLGAGNVSISSVLLAPTLENSLIAISQLAKNLDYFITFYSIHCVLQDNQTKMKIGTGRRDEVFSTWRRGLEILVVVFKLIKRLRKYELYFGIII